MNILKKLMYLLIAALLIAGCSDDDEDNPTGPGNGNGDGEVPQLNIKAAQVPQSMQQNQDPMAQQVTAWVQAVNSMRSFLTLPTGVNQTNDDTWTWTQDGLTATYQVTSNNNNRVYTWRLNGTDSDGDVYENFLMLRGTTAMNGESGEIIYYPYEANEDQVVFNWRTENDGAYVIEYTSGSERILLTNYENLSGEMEYFTSSGGAEYREARYTWNAAGAGEWWIYDENGDIQNSGTWQ